MESNWKWVMRMFSLQVFRVRHWRKTQRTHQDLQMKRWRWVLIQSGAQTPGALPWTSGMRTLHDGPVIKAKTWPKIRINRNEEPNEVQTADLFWLTNAPLTNSTCSKRDSAIVIWIWKWQMFQTCTHTALSLRSSTSQSQSIQKHASMAKIESKFTSQAASLHCWAMCLSDLIRCLKHQGDPKEEPQLPVVLLCLWFAALSCLKHWSFNIWHLLPAAKTAVIRIPWRMV